jgi:hypothetical protein
MQNFNVPDRFLLLSIVINLYYISNVTIFRGNKRYIYSFQALYDYWVCAVVVALQSQIDKSIKGFKWYRRRKLVSGRCNLLPEPINITEKLQKISQTAQDYKDAIVSQFKDMEVEVKDWNFAVGKNDKEYTVEVNLKLGIKSKKE